MGLYKLCEHEGRNRDRCDHPWWGSFRGVRVSLSKWTDREIRLEGGGQRGARRAAPGHPRAHVRPERPESRQGRPCHVSRTGGDLPRTPRHREGPGQCPGVRSQGRAVPGALRRPGPHRHPNGGHRGRDCGPAEAARDWPPPGPAAADARHDQPHGRSPAPHVQLGGRARVSRPRHRSSAAAPRSSRSCTKTTSGAGVSTNTKRRRCCRRPRRTSRRCSLPRSTPACGWARCWRPGSPTSTSRVA